MNRGEQTCKALNELFDIDGDVFDIGNAGVVHDYYGLGNPGNDFALGNRHDKDADWFKGIIEHRRQCHWWNDGTETRFCPECPDGFVPGRIPGAMSTRQSQTMLVLITHEHSGGT